MRTPRPLPEPLAREPFGVREAPAAGIARGRLRSRDLVQPFQGARATASSPSSLLELCRAYMARSPPHHTFSHTTAARLWGAPLPAAHEAERRLHVAALKPDALPRAAGVTGHRVDGGAIRIVRRHGLPVVDAASAWLQLASILPHDELVVVADHLVLRPAIQKAGDPRPYAELDELRIRVAAFHGRGAERCRRALRDVRQGAESRRETLLRLAIVRAGLPEPALNQRIDDALGRFIGRADMVYDLQRVIVEYDGEQHRTDDTQYHRDLVRLDAFREQAWQVIVVRKQHFTPHELPLLLARLARALHI